MILNENDYQAFVASIDLLSLHCPVCGVVGLFILYGHYKRFVIIDDISSGDCKIQIPVQRIQCTQCKSTHALLPTNFVPYTQFTYLFIYYIVTLDENDDLITSFEVALQTIRKVKARVIEFWDSLFPDWRNFKQDDLKIESLKRHDILFGSTRSYCELCVLSPTEAQTRFRKSLILMKYMPSNPKRVSMSVFFLILKSRFPLMFCRTVKRNIF